MHLLFTGIHTEQIFCKPTAVGFYKGTAVFEHCLGRHCFVVDFFRTFCSQAAFHQADAGAKSGYQSAVFPLLHSQGIDQACRSPARAGAGGIVRRQPFCQQRNVSIFLTCAPALQGFSVLGELFLNDVDSFFFRGCFQKTEQIVPAAEFCNISNILSCGFRPCKCDMTEQSTEEFPLAHSAADVPQMEEQLHGKIGSFDVGSVEQIDLVNGAAIAHTACHCKEIQTGVSCAAMCFRAVQSTGIIGFCFQIIQITHFFPHSSFPPC